MQKHPNAIVGGGTAAGAGALIVWVAALCGLAIPATVAPVIAGACAALVLAIGRQGIRGVARRVWRGAA